MAKPRALVLDTWAVIAYFEDEPAGENVAQLIVEANEDATPLWMSVVNAGEVWYVVARKTSVADADAAINDLRKLGVQFDDADWKVARQAAVFKSKHKMSYADAFVAASAVQKNAHLVTGDPEFKALEVDVKMLWLKR